MTNFKLPDSVSRKIHTVGFAFKKHSPTILVTAGTVGVVASAVLACRATLKVNEVVDKAKTNLDKIHAATENGVTEAGQPYTEEDSKKETAIVYVQTGVEFVKLYGPSILLGAASIASIIYAHNIQRNRIGALAAAYATVDSSFKEYRKRVVDRFGKELDKELKYNIKPQEVEEVVVNEDGSEQTVKTTVNVANPNVGLSQYARCFDETCAGWTRDSELNLMFLVQQQNYANDLLRHQKYLFLNDVYKMLGIPATKAGQIVGWVYDENHPNGDNYVDFGIHDLYNEQKRLFVNGYEKSIWLDFNVDGVVYDMLA